MSSFRLDDGNHLRSTPRVRRPRSRTGTLRCPPGSFSGSRCSAPKSHYIPHRVFTACGPSRRRASTTTRDQALPVLGAEPKSETAVMFRKRAFPASRGRPGPLVSAAPRSSPAAELGQQVIAYRASPPPPARDDFGCTRRPSRGMPIRPPQECAARGTQDVVASSIHEIVAQPDDKHVTAQFDAVTFRLERSHPKVAARLHEPHAAPWRR